MGMLDIITQEEIDIMIDACDRANTEFYQDNLIKTLESIKNEILENCNPVITSNTVAVIMDYYIDKAKEIQEINNRGKCD